MTDSLMKLSYVLNVISGGVSHEVNFELQYISGVYFFAMIALWNEEKKFLGDNFA